MRRTLALGIFGLALMAGGCTYEDGMVFDLGGPTVHASGPDIRRTMVWAGGPRVEFHVPAEISYAAGPVASVVISGPQSIVDRVYFDGDALRMQRGSYHFSSSVPLRVTFTAPGIEAISIGFSGRLTTAPIRQDRLTLDVTSGARAEVGDAQVRDLRVHVSSSGRLHAAGQATAADVEVSSGGYADIQMAGLATLRTEVSSSGRLDLKGGSPALDAEVHSGGHAELALDGAQSLRARVSSSGRLEVTGPAKAVDVEVESGGHASLQADADTLRADLSSSGDLRVTGRADRVEISASSGADADLSAVEVKDAQVKAEASSSVRINPKASLRAQASSGGRIRVESNPPVRDTSSQSSGKVDIDEDRKG